MTPTIPHDDIDDKDWSDPDDPNGYKLEDDPRQHYASIHGLVSSTAWIDPDDKHPDPLPPAVVTAVRLTCTLFGNKEDTLLCELLKMQIIPFDSDEEFNSDDYERCVRKDFKVRVGSETIVIQVEFDLFGDAPRDVLTALLDAFEATVAKLVALPESDARRYLFRVWLGHTKPAT